LRSKTSARLWLCEAKRNKIETNTGIDRCK